MLGSRIRCWREDISKIRCEDVENKSAGASLTLVN